MKHKGELYDEPFRTKFKVRFGHRRKRNRIHTQLKFTARFPFCVCGNSRDFQSKRHIFFSQFPKCYCGQGTEMGSKVGTDCSLWCKEKVERLHSITCQYFSKNTVVHCYAFDKWGEVTGHSSLAKKNFGAALQSCTVVTFHHAPQWQLKKVFRPNSQTQSHYFNVKTLSCSLSIFPSPHLYTNKSVCLFFSIFSQLCSTLLFKISVFLTDRCDHSNAHIWIQAPVSELVEGKK